MEVHGGGSVLGAHPVSSGPIRLHSPRSLSPPARPLPDPESLLQPQVRDSAVTSASPLRKLSTRRGCWRGCQDSRQASAQGLHPFATPAGWFGARHTHTHKSANTHLLLGQRPHPNRPTAPLSSLHPSPLQPHQPPH